MIFWFLIIGYIFFEIWWKFRLGYNCQQVHETLKHIQNIQSNSFFEQLDKLYKIDKSDKPEKLVIFDKLYDLKKEILI
jgi:hypothetical protein